MFLKELKNFIANIVSWIYFFVAFLILFSFFGLKEITIFGIDVSLPALSTNSFSVRFFDMVQRKLIPEGVELISVSPLDAFLTQIKISVLLAFIITLPYFFYKFFSFFKTAFHEKEKRSIIKVMVPCSLLFFSGCLFAYFILIPLTFRELYRYTFAMSIVPFFSTSEFVNLVLGFMLASGIMFLLPVFMSILCKIGIISSDFWLKNWRYAALFFLIVSAIITPDGSGISMVLFSFPLTGLYFAGWAISR